MIDKNTQGCCMLFWTNPRSSTPQNSSCTATYLLSYKLSKEDKQDMSDTAGDVRMNSEVMLSFGLPHLDSPVLVNQQRHIHQLFVYTGCHLEDLPITVTNRDR